MAAPTMSRAAPHRLPQPSDADLSFITSSPPPSPPPPPPAKNPWRIAPSGGAAAASAAIPVILMGEPSSSWPPLSSSQRRSDSPPHPPPPEIHPATATATGAEGPNATDLPSSSSYSSTSSTEETVPPATESPASPPPPPQPAAAAPSPPPPAPAPVPPPSPGNAAATAADQPRPPLRPAASPQRRVRNQRYHNQRGSGGPRSNNGYNNRPPAPGWRPNWSGFNSIPQYPHWGFYPGSAVSVVPPADVNPYFVPYAQPYNELVYPDYGAESYGAYYDQPAYEIPYAPPMSPTVAAVPPPQLAPSSSGAATRDLQVNTLKDQLISQIEYYFSDQNLIKDTYLRRQMDSQGWVDDHKIAGFRRVAALTDDISLIKDALQSSNFVEVQGNKMRKRHEWDKWIL